MIFVSKGLFSSAYICFQWPIHVSNFKSSIIHDFQHMFPIYVSNICFQYTWNLLIDGNILKHKKPWLDLLLVSVMFGGFHTCVTKMVVVPFLFLIYWCAFLVEFQELNFTKKNCYSLWFLLLIYSSRHWMWFSFCGRLLGRHVLPKTFHLWINGHWPREKELKFIA